MKKVLGLDKISEFRGKVSFIKRKKYLILFLCSNPFDPLVILKPLRYVKIRGYKERDF
jgi:hypothetical protein